jgi:hypothetical protein
MKEDFEQERVTRYDVRAMEVLGGCIFADEMLFIL